VSETPVVNPSVDDLFDIMRKMVGLVIVLNVSWGDILATLNALYSAATTKAKIRGQAART
jgi:hypothetical protein